MYFNIYLLCYFNIVMEESISNVEIVIDNIISIKEYLIVFNYCVPKKYLEVFKKIYKRYILIIMSL